MGPLCISLGGLQLTHTINIGPSSNLGGLIFAPLFNSGWLTHYRIKIFTLGNSTLLA